MKNQTVIVLDSGCQYNQTIARKIRDLRIYSEILPYSTPLEKIKELSPVAIILMGGTEKQSPMIDRQLFNLNIPILGIGYGARLIANLSGTAFSNEFVNQKIIFKDNPLFKGVDNTTLKISDCIKTLPQGFEVLANTESCSIAAFCSLEKRIYGTLFDIKSMPQGSLILRNFLYDIAGAKGSWSVKSFVQNMTQSLKAKIGDKRALCAFSGGVDSAVAATLVHNAVGDRLTCILVDHGLMRKDECEQIMKVFKDGLGMNLIKVDASDRFLQRLKGVKDPEQKRKIIGEEFIRVFEEEAKKLGKIDYLVQGTIYPDIVESGFGEASLVKSHHNVGGLPNVIDFEEIIEPLKDLFKDEVRKVGFELGLDESIVMRQPFPGPGLGIRIIGEITKEKLDILREADFIMREEIKLSSLDKEIWQYFAVLTDLRSVGVKKDKRTYDYTLGLRAVTSSDAMTADFARIPYEVLERISNRIVNEVKGINRIVYDITSKPPSTIEWE